MDLQDLANKLNVEYAQFVGDWAGDRAREGRSVCSVGVGPTAGTYVACCNTTGAQITFAVSGGGLMGESESIQRAAHKLWLAATSGQVR